MPGFPCILKSLLLLVGIPCPLHWTLQPRGLGCSSLYNPAILVTHFLRAFVPPGCSTRFQPSPSPPCLPHGLAEGHAHAGLSQVSLLLTVLFHMSAINPFHQSQEQPCFFFPFYLCIYLSILFTHEIRKRVKVADGQMLEGKNYSVQEREEPPCVWPIWEANTASGSVLDETSCWCL